MKNFIRIIFPALMLAAAFAAPSDPVTVVPMWIHDGDTFRATVIDRAVVDCRIYGIDAPELNQSWGKAVRAVLVEMIHQRKTSVAIHSQSYNRFVVSVSVEGRDVALELLKMGLAWYTPQYAKIPEYAAAEAEAKAARRGLWSEKSPVPPWKWREKK